MEPKLLAVLQNCDVATASIQEIAKSVKTAALFGSLGNTEEAFEMFIKLALGADTSTLQGMLEVGKCTMAWRACREKHLVEVRDAAQRSMTSLPPQLSDEDLDVCKRAFEAQYKLSLIHISEPTRRS